MCRARKLFGAAVLAAVLLAAGCGKTIGWGVLLWYTDAPAVPSGVVLPVYGRSNIEQLWIAGVPAAFRSGESAEGAAAMMEVPLPHLEVLGSKGAAERRAREFAEYAKTYAETMQDGLPVRDAPENNARRVYRLKRGEVVKVMGRAEGVPAMSTQGAPLPGDWLQVLTEGGVTGFCFSYRLNLFEHETGPLPHEKRDVETDGEDEGLDALSRVWYPKAYGEMAARGRLDLDALSRGWRFDAGLESGTARLLLPGVDMTFPYTAVRKGPDGVWAFEGSSLRAEFRSAAELALRFNDAKGMRQDAALVALAESPAALAGRERARRAGLFEAIYAAGPVYHSVNYGTLTFAPEFRFDWDGAGALPRGLRSGAALDGGSVNMGRFLEGDLGARYTGALALVFDSAGGARDELTFLYSLETQGLRLEHVPDEHIRDGAVFRAGTNPLVIYFSRGDLS